MGDGPDSADCAVGAAVEALRERILPWFAENGRDLPWRHTSDPYALVVAELMLQQTGVERVVPRWQRFLDRFPSWASLAGAPLGEVIREWQGMGYNRRAVNLHRLAVAVVEQYGGALPASRRELLALPGIGPYTANAILSFVHGQDVPTVDVNLRRVIGRVVLGDADAPLATITEVASRAIPAGQSGAWNQALMDFAARQCTLRRPACRLCPLRDACRWVNRAAEVASRGGDREGEVGQSDTLFASNQERPPARRAAERPAPYLGSTRYWRGRIVDVLRALPAGATLSVDEIGVVLGAIDPGIDVASLTAALERDGLVARETGTTPPRYRLP